MIIFPMCGESSRFFSQGFSIPKYQLPLGKNSVFYEVINGFKNYFKDELFLFIIKKNYFSTKEFIEREIKKYSTSISNYKIIELEYQTSGQAHTVMCGLNALENVEKEIDFSKEKLVIFNIDTIRKNIEIPIELLESPVDSFLEVVNYPGDNWSFVIPSKYFRNKVQFVTEKIRSSDLCSTGLYGFNSIKKFKEIFLFLKRVKGEYYISPMFNSDRLKDVRYYEISPEDFLPCGTPLEYNELFKEYAKKL